MWRLSARLQHAGWWLARSRHYLVLSLLALATTGIVARAAWLQLLQNEFLQAQGNERFLRTVPIPAHRGMILDRHDDPLAVSSPVDTLWADPRVLLAPEQQSRLPRLATALGLKPAELERRLAARHDKEFMYLQRHLTPEAAQRVLGLQIPGVYARREYRRYYPTGEVTSHLLGFTDIDDQGQEGLERAFNAHLAGRPGAKQVIQDRLGRVVEDVEILQVPEPGRPLSLSIDRRIQFLAYRALKAAVIERQAAGASAVVVDVRTGEILAMVNQPAGNPNDRTQLRPDLLRNRAVTDVFEPGSTAKALSVALALERGVVKPTTPINTSPGILRIGRYTVTDVHNAGAIDVTRVISKSSNVGTSKIAFLLPAEQLWRFYDRLGFGKSTGLFKVAGEQPGVLRPASAWGGAIGHANHAFGYGFSVTALQLAQAYTVLAADGVRRELSIVRREAPPAGEPRLLSVETARQMRLMMEQAVSQQGTGARATVAGYRVAGKTGTARKVVGRHYTTNHYRALFAGLVPATRPRLVGVIMVDDPRRGGYYGGTIAAPIFSDIMTGALRILNVPPDAVPDAKVATTAPTGR